MATPAALSKHRNNSNSKNKNPVIWWDEECSKVIRLRKAALKKWKYCKTISNYIEYKKAVAITRKTLKYKKNKSQKFCQ